MVWHFCSCKNTAKIERIHKRALKFMLNDFTSDYETLIAKANTSTLEVLLLYFYWYRANNDNLELGILLSN